MRSNWLFFKSAIFDCRQAHGARVQQDLSQLWRRIVFSMCVSNTDDHLRNHGFLSTAKGWVLSLAFDLNPNPDGDGLRLNVSESDNSQNFDLALEVAPYFRLDQAKAERILKEILEATRNWRARAMTLGISRIEQEKMSRAFRMTK